MGLTKNEFPRIIARLTPQVDAAVGMGAGLIANEAGRRAPVGDPDVHLSESIKAKRTGLAEWRVVVGGRGKGEVFYGHMVEFGTVHSSAQPFLVPAVEDKKVEVLGLVNAALRRL